MAGGMNVVPFPGGAQPPALGMMGGGMPQPMMPNPAFQQWMQMAQAWQQETQKNEQEFLSACRYINKDASKRYNIDIEADSTIAPDQEAEKAARTQFLQAITPFMQAVLPEMASNPALAPLGKELIMFAVRGFTVSRQLEDAFETALDEMMKAPPQPSPQKGNTKSPQEVQTEAEVAKGDQQTDLAVAQIRAQSDKQKNAVEMMKLFSQTQLDQARLASEEQHRQAQLALDQRVAAMRESMASARMSHYAASDERGLV